MTHKNPCMRCGTNRIVIRTSFEKIGNSTVTNIETSCPNPECQRKVDIDNKRQTDKRLAMKSRSEERARARKNKKTTIS
ncbi:hypothetical protein HY214_00795 [Candidatus Roizmanbacteria bacterium]|nr:hypothetical protein [Candidatus Roizmanbacteria bacterium]